jgi:D-glycero-D-manno-heptose 1,7-bisphosphate phosphatase
MAAFNAINDKMTRTLAQVGGRIDAVFYCPHAADAYCDCRKPRAGMLREIGRRFNSDLKEVPAVGDALRDLQAAHEVGATPVLVTTGKGRITLKEGNLPANTQVFDDLAAFARHIAG